MNAEDRAKSKAGESWYDLPDNIRTLLIEQEQLLIEKEQQLAEQKPIVDRYKEYKEQEKANKLAVEETVQFYKEKGIPERIGMSSINKKLRQLVPVEENHIDVSCEFPSNEQHPVSYIGGLVMGFRRETVEALCKDAQVILNNADRHEDVRRNASAYMLFYIWSGGIKRSCTNVVLIGDRVVDHIDELYNNLDSLLNLIEDKSGGYEYVYSGNRNCYLSFYFKASYFPEPKSIDNWGSNINKIEERVNFKIFTANNRSIPCIQQVAIRLFKDSNINTLNGIIEKANGKVCIFKPHNNIIYVRQIKSYRDLVIHEDSPVKSFHVIDSDIIYLLMFKDHLGVLEGMTPPKKSPYKTIFRPINKLTGVEKVTVCFDIECYFDPLNDQKHVPYLCCCCFILDNEINHVKEYDTRDCVARMIEYCVDVAKELNLHYIELVAHNGGAYDFHYLLTAMVDPSIIKNILIRNSNFISFSFKHNNVNFTVKDSYNFLCCSLQNASKAFLGSAEKTDFPHHEARTKEDLQKVFNKWISVEKEISVSNEKEKLMVIKSKDVINYDDSNDSKKLIDWAKEYCTNDVIVLANVWKKFKQTVYDVFNCKVVDQTYTLAGMSFRLFEANLHSMVNGMLLDLKHPNKKEYMNMRKSLIGGRCISVNNIYTDIMCLDVKSLYPAAMAYYEQPYGEYRKVTKEISYTKELGIYYCKVTPNMVNIHGFFPMKYDDKVRYKHEEKDTVVEYEAWYTSIDMLIGRDEGHSIEVIPFEDDYVGYSWKYKGKIFKEYIENVLYRLKLEYERAKKKEHRWIIKIIMNSLWGKFAQKWIENSYKIKLEHNIEKGEVAEKIFDTNYMMVKQPNGSEQADKPIQNGIYTLSWARYHMKKCWDSIAKERAVCVYSDTDSIMVNKVDIDNEAMMELDGKIVKTIGEEMGQLEIESIFSEFITVGKKQYIGRYGTPSDPLYKKRFKGIPLSYIRPELFTHLIECKDNIAEINFLKFKREWGIVRGYIESKKVKQT